MNSRPGSANSANTDLRPSVFCHSHASLSNDLSLSFGSIVVHSWNLSLKHIIRCLQAIYFDSWIRENNLKDLPVEWKLSSNQVSAFLLSLLVRRLASPHYPSLPSVDIVENPKTDSKKEQKKRCAFQEEQKAKGKRYSAPSIGLQLARSASSLRTLVLIEWAWTRCSSTHTLGSTKRMKYITIRWLWFVRIYSFCRPLVPPTASFIQVSGTLRYAQCRIFVNQFGL
jgi:hypothetical protein